MPNKTDIEWTDLTSNPVKFRVKATGQRAWHCEKVSPGCAKCYAERLELGRFGSGRPFTPEGGKDLEAYLDEAELLKILRMKPGTSAKHGGPVKIFLEDMSDLFGAWVKDEWLDKIFAVMALRPDLIFQVLTKRAERMQQYFADPVERHMRIEDAGQFDEFQMIEASRLPYENLWLGVSVENEARKEERILKLLATPAAVRWVSVEPMLEEVNLERPVCPKHGFDEMGCDNKCQDYCAACDREKVECDVRLPIRDLRWIVCGGESGRGARPFDIAWPRSLLAQAKCAGVPVFMKQLGRNPTKYVSDGTDSGESDDVPLMLDNPKGGDPAEWPSDLQVREFPHIPCVLGGQQNFALKGPALPRAKA